MDTSFLQQLFLAKLEEATLYGHLLEESLVSNADVGEKVIAKELENWLIKLNSWQSETTAFKIHTSRLSIDNAANAEVKKSGSGKKAVASLAATFEGIEISREVVNKKGPMFSAGYHQGRQLLDVEFKPETVYRYYGVPPELYEQLIENPRQAMSIFTKNIRNNYEFKQLPSLS